MIVAPKWIVGAVAAVALVGLTPAHDSPNRKEIKRATVEFPDGKQVQVAAGTDSITSATCLMPATRSSAISL